LARCEAVRVDKFNGKKIIMEYTNKTIKQLIDAIIIGRYKVICINGKTASGKTTLCNLLKKHLPKYKFYHNDDYKENGFEQGLYDIMDAIDRDCAPYIVVEGVQVPRLLRKWKQLGRPDADLIIETSCSYENRVLRYKTRGDADKIPNLAAFDKMLARMFWDYAADGKTAPIWRLCTD